MSEALSNLDQNSVLNEVRRALGRSVTVASVPPSPLGPFIEPTSQAELSELIVRFTEEATAVRANVHRASDELQFVDTLAEICAENKGQEIALSGAELFAEIDLPSMLFARGFPTPPELRALDHDSLVARLANCGAGVTAVDY